MQTAESTDKDKLIQAWKNFNIPFLAIFLIIVLIKVGSFIIVLDDLFNMDNEAGMGLNLFLSLIVIFPFILLLLLEIFILGRRIDHKKQAIKVITIFFLFYTILIIYRLLSSISVPYLDEFISLSFELGWIPILLTGYLYMRKIKNNAINAHG